VRGEARRNGRFLHSAPIRFHSESGADAASVTGDPSVRVTNLAVGGNI